MEKKIQGPNFCRPLHFSIGNMPFSLFIPQETLFLRALQRYSAFAGNGPDGFPIFLKPADAPPRRDGKFSYTLDDASLFLDSSRAEFRGVRHEYALDSLLRILLTVVLLPRSGFLLHAATVVRDGRAYVFPGRSGAGKSTVASLSPAGSVLTDEISLLQHSDGCWQAYGTPFWGEFRAAGLNRRFPLAGIYSLVQAPEERIEPLSTKGILRALLPCVLFFSRRAHANESLLRVLLDLIERVPCHRMHFRRNAEFWKGIAA